VLRRLSRLRSSFEKHAPVHPSVEALAYKQWLSTVASVPPALIRKGHDLDIRRYQDMDFERLDDLWSEAFSNDPPRNRAINAIPAKLSFQPDLLFVAVEGADVLGSVMAGYDGHRGWLYSVAVRRSARRRYLGTMLVRHAEQALSTLGCSKVNLQVRSSNEVVVRFYEKLGYVVEDRVSLGRRIS
jgi:ribosomal protein S18 acetylase RimI-like enzyme